MSGRNYENRPNRISLVYDKSASKFNLGYISVWPSIGMNRTVVLMLCSVAVLGLLVPANSYAMHSTEEITWQLVVISSSACSGYHYQIAARYDDVTKKYLELYQQPNVGLEPKCLTSYDFDTEFETPESLDLLIIVYDRNKGRADLHSYGIGGIYSHVGEEWTHNHTIVICDCSNFNYSDPVWILSHELSHFVLYYLGYDLSITEKEIHAKDAKYDYCVEEKYDESCNSSKTKIRTEVYSYSWTVMSPYEPAIGQKLFTSETVEPILDSSFKTDMIAAITTWWLEGKILDEDYMKSFEILTGETDFKKRVAGGFASADRANVILTEPPKSKKLGAPEIDVSQWTEQKRLDVEEMITYTEEQKSILSTEEIDKQLPDWFKTRAMWWVTEKIDNDEFIAGMEFMTKQ